MLQQWLILGVTVPKMLEAAREMHRVEGVAKGEPLTPKQVSRPSLDCGENVAVRAQ